MRDWVHPSDYWILDSCNIQRYTAILTHRAPHQSPRHCYQIWMLQSIHSLDVPKGGSWCGCINWTIVTSEWTIYTTEHRTRRILWERSQRKNVFGMLLERKIMDDVVIWRNNTKSQFTRTEIPHL